MLDKKYQTQIIKRQHLRFGQKEIIVGIFKPKPRNQFYTCYNQTIQLLVSVLKSHNSIYIAIVLF